uniref:C2H2-type domain-containing protein n=1 Tax=Stomoxys calcitrans TaxID=35570 RepID=A0A1I8PDZ6_STOCA
MSILPTNLCRLCLHASHDLKTLYEKNGHGNALYNIIVEHFQPKVLNLMKATHLKGICKDCWAKTWDLHHFQQLVAEAQAKLEAMGEKVVEVKVEEPEENYVYAKTTNNDLDFAPTTMVKVERDLVDGGTKVKQEPLLSTDEADDDDDGEDEDDVDEEALLKESQDDDDSEDKEYDEDNDNDENFSMETDYSTNSLRKPKLEIVDVPDDMDEADEEMPLLKYKAEGDQSESNLEVPDMKCIVCLEPFNEFSLLREHFRQKHPRHEFYILCCQRKFNIQSQIEGHRHLHKNPHAFRCELCGRCHTTKSGLFQHKKRVHPFSQNKEYACDKCDRSFTTERGLLYHDTTIHNGFLRSQPKVIVQPDGFTIYRCNDCGYACNFKRAFSQHWWYEHRLVPKHKCPECGKLFKKPFQLRKHQRSHKEKNVCTTCFREFTRLSDLQKHIEKKHTSAATEGQEKKTKLGNNCTTFQESPNLKKPKPAVEYPCKYCKQIFNKEDSLRLHIEEIHKPDHKCYLCNRAFRSARGVISHIAKHKKSDTDNGDLSLIADEYISQNATNVSPLNANDPNLYKCSICEKLFESYVSMRRHYLGHKKGETFFCEICDRRFTRANNLKMHRINQHGLNKEENLPDTRDDGEEEKISKKYDDREDPTCSSKDDDREDNTKKNDVIENATSKDGDKASKDEQDNDVSAKVKLEPMNMNTSHNIKKETLEANTIQIKSEK